MDVREHVILRTQALICAEVDAHYRRWPGLELVGSIRALLTELYDEAAEPVTVPAWKQPLPKGV